MDRVSRTFLGRGLAFAGCIPMDPAVREAVQYRVPFALYAPQARATRALQRLTRGLIGLETAADRNGHEGFFARLAGWLSPRQGNSGSD
jgi:MinD-like ATPase involved in chromosome partitioning or flagellar assembly